jgi:hypothetical protein
LINPAYTMDRQETHMKERFRLQTTISRKHKEGMFLGQLETQVQVCTTYSSELTNKLTNDGGG